MNNKERSALYLFRFLAAAVVVMGLTFAGIAAEAAVKQKGFATPEEAVKAIITAMRNNDDKELIAIFGPSAKDLIFSGDPVADKQRRELLLRKYDEKNSLVSEKGGMVIVIGNDDWPFPIPLVKKGDVWYFDTDKGREEILNRRIGDNELSTIQTMLAIVDAQREYAMKAIRKRWQPRVCAEVHERSREEERSLLGDKGRGGTQSRRSCFAQAKKEGYKERKSGDKPSPFHGYYFRMLTKQGKHAPEGAFDYIVKGKMTGGFAVVASPAKYGNSGVMTFIVNQDGVVYQKDLGKNTAKTVMKIKSFDPDKTWKKIE